MPDKTTHFGFKNVSPDEKTQKVGEVFTSVANKYDVMNDVMSLGMHRLWKRYFVNLINIRPNYQILDLAAGTGDIAALLAPKIGENGSITLCDPNAEMLELARQRLIDKGLVKNINYVQAHAEELTFDENQFDRITLAFGLRNFTHKEKALQAIYRILKPGGQLLILEFSKPQKFLKQAYDTYSFKVLPKMGKVIANDEESYQYLAESIRKHPDQEALNAMLEKAGFEKCDYLNLAVGIVSIHRGYKLQA